MLTMTGSVCCVSLFLKYISKLDLGVGEIGSIFCGTHPLLATRIEVSVPGHKGYLVNKQLNIQYFY